MLYFGLYQIHPNPYNKNISREKCPNTEFFWSVFSRIQSGKNSVFGRFTQCFAVDFNPILDGGRGSPVTSANLKIRPQNSLTFSFNPFDRLM